MNGAATRKPRGGNAEEVSRKDGVVRGIGLLLLLAAVGVGGWYGYRAYQTSQERRALARQEKVDQMDERRARVVRLMSAVETALDGAELAVARALISELESAIGVCPTTTALRRRYESLISSRGVEMRWAEASVARDRAAALSQGQGFAARLRAVDTKWCEAEEARKGQQWEKALLAYDAVLLQETELQALEAGRTRAKKAQSAFVSARQAAAGNEAATDAEALWSKAERSGQDGERAFSEGDFSKAIKSWQDAVRGYDEARDYAFSAQKRVSVALKEKLEPNAGDERTVSLGDGVELEMVWVPAGSFSMGCSTSKFISIDVSPHQVTLSSGFWMGTYEVTQDQWQHVMGDLPVAIKTADPSAPIGGVSWDDCQEFLGKINGAEVKGTFRLPTEAQWEYACRAGTATSFGFGEHDEDLHLYANYCDRSYTGTDRRKDKKHVDGYGQMAPVGSFNANAWGLHDMHGNVWEWCQDGYAKYPTGSVMNPTGAVTGGNRVLRGGSWVNRPEHCRSAYRGQGKSTCRSSDLGLRVVLML